MKRAPGATATGDALIVGLARAVVCAIFLFVSERQEALLISALGPSRWTAPSGLGWFVQHVPISVASAAFAGKVYVACALFGIVGLYTRLALFGLLASGTYLFAIRQLTGAVFHDMHLLWFLAILWASNASRALSLDAVFARAEGQSIRVCLEQRELDADASATLHSARSVLGIVYFFPGFWKLWESGLSWALSDNLANQMHAKWFQHQSLPGLRIDHSPILLRAAGIGTLLFELGFIFFVNGGPRIRLALALSGVLFHLSIEKLMLIPFSSLWLCYVFVLSAPRSLLVSTEEPAPRRTLLVHTVASLLLLCNMERGFRGITQSFPFACYPTFQWIQGPTLPDLIVTHDSQPVRVARDASGRRTQTQWGEVWSVAGIYGAPFSRERLLSFLRQERPELHGTVEVSIGHFETTPERWGSPPVRVQPLATLDVP